MPTARINGVDIYYEQHGQGPPLLLIMGLRRNADWWWKQLPAFSPHFQVTAFDNRGSGRSDKPEMEYSIRMMADDAAGLMAHLGIASAVVLGYSMGGYIAQELALAYPQKVERLILVSTGAGGQSAVQMDPECQKEFANIVGLSPEEVLNKNLDIYFSPGFIEKNPGEVAEFIRVSLKNPQPDDAFLRQYDACLRHDTSGRSQGIKLPLLIMTGSDDPLVPPGNSRILFELMPQAQLREFPGGRHCFFIEMPDKFNQSVLEFLGAGAPVGPERGRGRVDE